MGQDIMPVRAEIVFRFAFFTYYGIRAVFPELAEGTAAARTADTDTPFTCQRLAVFHTFLPPSLYENAGITGWLSSAR